MNVRIYCPQWLVAYVLINSSENEYLVMYTSLHVCNQRRAVPETLIHSFDAQILSSNDDEIGLYNLFQLIADRLIYFIKCL